MFKKNLCSFDRACVQFVMSACNQVIQHRTSYICIYSVFMSTGYRPTVTCGEEFLVNHELVCDT